jgi:hypothetical protein
LAATEGLAATAGLTVLPADAFVEAGFEDTPFEPAALTVLAEFFDITFLMFLEDLDDTDFEGAAGFTADFCVFDFAATTRDSFFAPSLARPLEALRADAGAFLAALPEEL